MGGGVSGIRGGMASDILTGKRHNNNNNNNNYYYI